MCQSENLLWGSALVFINFKGGSMNTTHTASMATIASESEGWNTVVVDLDSSAPQANSIFYQYHYEEQSNSLKHTEISRTFGFSEAQISRLFILMTASVELKKIIIDNDLQVSAAYKLARLGKSDLARAIEAIKKNVPIEVISGGSSRASENKELDRSFSKKQSPGLKNGMTLFMPKDLNRVWKDLAGTMPANLSERELIVLAQIQEAENQLWNEQLSEIRRIPKSVLWTKGKVLDQLMKVDSYMDVLDRRQIKILLKVVLIATQKLLEKADRE